MAQADGKPFKVDKWDGCAVKNALDDAAKQVFTEKFGYSEKHALMNGRLILCTIAVGFALFAVLWDYLFPFPTSRPILIACVLSYFFMMIVLTLYTSYKEKGYFMTAMEKDEAGVDPDNIWSLASHLKRYDDMYELYMTYTNGLTGRVQEMFLCKSVANFFDENGYLCEDIFEDEVKKLHSSLLLEKKDN